ncbi:MAG: M28 family peptidase [Candidatus Omnitrophica bacterium]|nr:M28 family peptidase [Candidatus Omnitrophota bacterium]
MYERLEEAAEYITKDFKSIGYDVEFQEYDLMNKRVKNIIAIKIGTQRPDEIVIVGAHYDTCFNPGADDNASAVAGLLELARFMYDKKRDCTIRFIAFVNEEPPFFKTDEMGSSVYARAARSRRDTIGFVPGVDFSDNWSFWREGYPAVMITDTAFYRNPNYHNSTDTHETLDYASLAEVLKGLRGVLIELTK